MCLAERTKGEKTVVVNKETTSCVHREHLRILLTSEITSVLCKINA